MAEARPNVEIKEESIPGALVAVATGRVAYVGIFERGKAGEFLYIEDENDLVNTVGAPTSDTTLDFHICKDLLQSVSDLVLVRAIDPDTAKMARIGVIGANIESGWNGDPIDESGDDVYFTDYNSHTIKAGNDLEFYAKEAFDDGSKISIAISKYTGDDWASCADMINSSNDFSDTFEFGPDDSNGEIALAILYDNVIVEKFIVSLTVGAKNAQGENIYIADYLDANSEYIYGFAGISAFDNISSFEAVNLQDGSKGTTPSTGDIETAYSKFLPKNDISYDYILDGSHYANRAYIIDTIAEGRKDIIAFVGPKKTDLFSGDVPLSNSDTIVSNIVTDRQTLTNSSWASYYGNWKQVYDKYQDKNIWIPIVPSVVANKVSVNTNREMWIPAAGTINGILKNVIKLAFNPSERQQNTLYKNGINHVYFKPGKGYIVDGQKTMYNINVGVSRVNIRDLFRVVEIYIGNLAVDYLQQFNDAITRNRFLSVVNPYLEDIQTRGGIVRFLVVCDETINTDAVINAFGFRANITMEGKRPIENITLKFYDIPAGYGFDEIA